MTAAAGDPPDEDPSMDDILASIRRIMLDEQARLQDSPGASVYTAGRAAGATKDPVLILDSSMVVEDMASKRLGVSLADETVIMLPPERATRPTDPADVESAVDARDAAESRSVPPDAATADAAVPVAREPEALPKTTVVGASGAGPVGLDAAAQQAIISTQAIEALMAPAAAAAAAASVEALLKQLSEERLAGLQPAASPSPTIEDVVRAELRPYLKAWLDEHLPPMVERLVRTEITRLIGRSGF
jgi:cell pole-organizing protein PopZ